MNRLFAVCALAMIIITGLCLPSLPGAAAASYKSIADGNTDLAVDLYRELGKPGGNLFFSPLSISSALAMTYAGSRGDTALQMKGTLHFQLEQAALNSAFRGLNQKLALNADRSGQKLNIANALVLTGRKVSNSYEKVLKTYYDAEIFSGDIGAINSWVKRKTEGKIPSILDALSANSVCVILNAVYFKGTWDAQFDKSATRDATFTVSGDTKVKVPLMHRKDNYRLLKEGAYQAISMPYKDKGLSMVAILPDRANGLASLEAQLKARDLRDILARLDKQPERQVSVYFPRFTMESKYDLSAPFQAMGMRDAFSPTADFTGMGWRKGDLWIGQIKHRAFVDVNEEGTEAAAATAVEMVTKSMVPRETVFRADHPFMFLIRHNETGTILFMGRMVNPVQQ